MNHIRPRVVKLCGIDGCDEPHFGLGYCSSHYWRFNPHKKDPKVTRENLTPFGENLMEAIDAKGLTQKSLCAKAGVSPFTIIRLARGDYEPKMATLCSLAAALNCEVWELLKPGHFKETA